MYIYGCIPYLLLHKYLVGILQMSKIECLYQRFRLRYSDQYSVLKLRMVYVLYQCYCKKVFGIATKYPLDNYY